MKKKQTYIVDGYNVIRTTEAYKSTTHNDFDSDFSNPVRERLIADVAAWAKLHGAQATIVFDGTANPQSTGEPQNRAGITIRFSKNGQSADTLIEKLAHEAFARGENVTVVSSDSTIKWTVGITEVHTMSSKTFSQVISAIHEDQKELIAEESRARMTLGSRIDPKVAQILYDSVRKR